MVELDIVHIQNDFLRYDTFNYVVAKIQVVTTRPEITAKIYSTR